MKPDDDFWLKMTFDVGDLSNCVFLSVGSVLVKNYRILSFGYNGTLPGAENCCDHFKDRMYGDEFRQAHKEWSDVNHIHAEQNAIMDAMSRGQDCKGATLYITHMPCLNCQKLILLAGITRVVYVKTYGTITPELLTNAGIKVLRVPFYD